MAQAASPHDLQVTRLDHAIMYLHPARTAPTRHTPSRRRTCHHKPWPQCRLCGHQTAGTTALAMHPSAGCAHSPLPYRTGSAYHQRADVRSTRRAARSRTWCWKLRRCLRRLRICGPRTRRATRRPSYATETEEERLHTRPPLPYAAGPFVRSPDRGTTALVMPPPAGRDHLSPPVPHRKRTSPASRRPQHTKGRTISRRTVLPMRRNGGCQSSGAIRCACRIRLLLRARFLPDLAEYIF